MDTESASTPRAPAHTSAVNRRSFLGLTAVVVAAAIHDTTAAADGGLEVAASGLKFPEGPMDRSCWSRSVRAL